MAEQAGPATLTAGPAVDGSRGVLGLADWLMGHGGTARGGVRALACGAGGIAGMCWAKRDRRR